jgi:hypothetical protein
MRKNDLDLRATPNGSGHAEIHYNSSSIEWKLYPRLRDSASERCSLDGLLTSSESFSLTRTNRRTGMYEYESTSPVQFIEDSVELLVAKVVTMSVRFQDKSITAVFDCSRDLG